MTPQDLKNQLQTYGIVNFKNYYRVQYYCVQNYLGLQGGKRGQERPDFPIDDLTHQERNSLFWDTLGIEKHAQMKAKRKDKDLETMKKIVREYVEPVAEPYEGRFKEFFNRF